MTWIRTYSRWMYSHNRLNMNRIPCSVPRSSYSTCKLVTVVLTVVPASERVSPGCGAGAAPPPSRSMDWGGYTLGFGLCKTFVHFLCWGGGQSIIHLIPLPIRTTPTTAIPSRDFCTISDPPPLTLPLYAIHHTILVMTISCKG